MSNQSQPLSAQIQSLLTNSRKSAYSIAKESGVEESTISRIKSPNWGKRIDLINKILKAIGKRLVVEDDK